ncbi:MAG: helicase-associated domain-containing protein [Spirochaetales bacterium]|nr:helicase-associated domain-containing protein [Spirochaetales bacterium]
MTAAVQDWKKIMLGLPDQDFFDIIRNYLGPVKTPFNKHTLIQKLVNFIEKNRQIILSCIEEKDAAILSAIGLMETATSAALQQLFSAEKKYLELHLQLLNLEERLLVFRSDNIYRLNPLFREYLAQHIISPSFLIRTRDCGKVDPCPVWIQQHLFFGLYSLLFHRGHESGTGLKKKVIEIAEKVMPALKSEHKGHSRIESFYSIISATGILSGNLYRNSPSAGDFFRKNRLQARDFSWWLLASCILAGMYLKTGRRLQLNVPLVFLNHFLSLMPAAGCVHKNDIRKIIVLYDNGSYSAFTQLIHAAMTDCGLLVENTKHHFCLNPGLSEWLRLFEGKGEIIPGQGYEITVPPQLSPADYFRIAQFAEIRQGDLYAHYEISKQSTGNAFNTGMDCEGIIGLIEKNASHSLPQNIAFSLGNWYEEFSRVRIFRGMLLVLKKDFADIIEKSGIIAKWVQEKIDDGIYLMDEKAEKAWKSALTRSGINTMPDTITAETGLYPEMNSIEPLVVRINTDAASQKPALLPEPLCDSQELRNTVMQSPLRPDEKAELIAGIEKKIIILKEQIRPGLLKAEKAEARGIDYAGKLRIIEQSLKSGKDLLEIQEAQGPRIFKVLVDPVKLDKSGPDVVLYGKSLPDYADWKIAVRKISLVKKLKASLYMP